MLIDLTESELQLLQQILRNERRSMLNEIAHTDSRDFRDELRRRYERLEAIAQTLEQPRRDRGPDEAAAPVRW